MNRTGQVFIGLAIAIIFPVFVLYAAVTFIAAHKDDTTPPVEPSYVYSQPQVACPLALSTTAQAVQVYNECAAQNRANALTQADYDAAEAKYVSEERAYEQKQTDEDSLNTLVDLHRSFLALGLALIGLISVIFMLEVPALVYGLASGAGIALLGSISTILSFGENAKMQSGGVMLALFAVLVGMGLVFDRKVAVSLPASQLPSDNDPIADVATLAPVVAPVVHMPEVTTIPAEAEHDHNDDEPHHHGDDSHHHEKPKTDTPPNV